MLTFFDKENRDISREMEEPTEFCDNPTCLGEPWCSALEICSEMMDRAATAVPEEKKIYSNSIIKEPKERDSQASCSDLPQTTTGQSFRRQRNNLKHPLLFPTATKDFLLQ